MRSGLPSCALTTLLVACGPKDDPTMPASGPNERLSAAHARYHERVGPHEHTTTPSPAPGNAPSPAPPPSPSPSTYAPSPSEPAAPSPGPTPAESPLPLPSLSPRTCGKSPWLTYGHDAARTSASDGCLDAPLRVTWTFTPKELRGRKERIEHAVADSDSVFAAGVRDGSPIVHRLAASSTHETWAFESRADDARSTWPTVAHGMVIFVDHSVYLVDRDKGTMTRRGPDTSGPSLADETRFYVANTGQERGSQPYVSGFDAAGKAVWKADKVGARGSATSDAHAIALDNGRLFHAANYPFANQAYVSALDPATGIAQWKVSAAPQSAISAGNGRLHLIERSSRGLELVARSQKDGTMVWSVPVTQPRSSAPVIAGSRVVIQTDTEVVAFDAETGTRAWATALPSKPSPSPNATSLAVAMGSATLFVTAGGHAHLLSLATGEMRWSFEPTIGKDIHSPIVVGSSAYVTVDGALVRFDGAPP